MLTGTETRVIYCGHVNGVFFGFGADALFKLQDGTYWLQDELKHWYFYAYNPEVELHANHGSYRLRVVGQSHSVLVKPLTNVITSQISGAFTGWTGQSIYELTNGQVWKQCRHCYEYRYHYRPEAVVYEGLGGKVMDVSGCRASVKRIR